MAQAPCCRTTSLRAWYALKPSSKESPCAPASAAAAALSGDGLVAAVGVIAVKAIMTRSTCRAQAAPIDPFVRDELVTDMRASARSIREEKRWVRMRFVEIEGRARAAGGVGGFSIVGLLLLF